MRCAVPGHGSRGDRIGDAVAGLKTSKSEAKSEFERHFPPPASGGLTDLLNRQPLALAAVGVAVGAAIASAFPSTGIEDRLMGTAGKKLKETLADATDAVAVKAGSVIEGAADEAAQNLTPEAVKQAVRAGAAKIKTVAEAGPQLIGKVRRTTSSRSTKGFEKRRIIRVSRPVRS